MLALNACAVDGRMDINDAVQQLEALNGGGARPGGVGVGTGVAVLGGGGGGGSSGGDGGGGGAASIGDVTALRAALAHAEVRTLKHVKPDALTADGDIDA